MIRALLFALLLLPALAGAQEYPTSLGTNFAALRIRDRASFATNPPPREPTDDEKLLAEAVRLIDLCRLGASVTLPDAQRKVYARQCLDQTDPVARPVELGP